ncbi:hypothetical protein [uncultured Ruminococcus sp.]|jgi:hypothetical protein|uniref:hypothetical protein n=1 Tax=Ruminococcus sp. TaxID=41978 RepID=UPI00266EEB7C|nr:hypothetical protein [uncultured Ruminococcus sp.]
MKEHNYKMNISQAEFFNILGNHTLKDMPLSNLNRNTASDTTLYGSVKGKSAKLCPHPADKYKPFNPINEITAEERGTQLDVCVKSYTNKKDIIFWIGFLVLVTVSTCLVLFLSYPEIYTELPFIWFLPVFDIIAVSLLFGFMIKSNKNVFFKRFEKIFKDYIVQ